MFSEKLGRLFFKRIPFPFFYFFLLIFPLAATVFLFMEKHSVDLLAEQLQISERKSKTAVERKSKKERFVQRHLGSDPYFVSKELEKLSFLGSEKESLKKWLNHPALANKAPLLQRLRSLENGANHLVFQEEGLQLSKLYKETLEKQKKPVEMDQQDLKKVLSVIEEISKENHPELPRPQLIISQFDLQRKLTALETEVFEVNIDLFKREFLSP